MWKWSRKKAELETQHEQDMHNDLAVSLKAAKGYDEDLEAISGFSSIVEEDLESDNHGRTLHQIEAALPATNVVKKTSDIAKLSQCDDVPVSGDETEYIHSLLAAAKSKVKELNREQLDMQNQSFNERIAKLKTLRETSKAEPSEFQQLLNRIKERNFRERMDYMMAKINQAHRNDHHLTKNADDMYLDERQIAENEVAAKNAVAGRHGVFPENYYQSRTERYKYIRETMQNSLTNPSVSKCKSESVNRLVEQHDVHKQPDLHRLSEELRLSNQTDGDGDNRMVTLSVKQLRELVQGTVRDVLKELGIEDS